MKHTFLSVAGFVAAVVMTCFILEPPVRAGNDTTYIDKNSYFRFTPPDSWQKKEFEDPRSKVEFFVPTGIGEDRRASLFVLAHPAATLSPDGRGKIDLIANAKDRVAKLKDTGAKDARYRVFTFCDVNAIQFDACLPQTPMRMHAIWFVKYDRSYTISFTTPPPLYEEYLPSVDRALSTFRCISPAEIEGVSQADRERIQQEQIRVWIAALRGPDLVEEAERRLLEIGEPAIAALMEARNTGTELQRQRAARLLEVLAAQRRNLSADAATQPDTADAATTDPMRLTIAGTVTNLDDAAAITTKDTLLQLVHIAGSPDSWDFSMNVFDEGIVSIASSLPECPLPENGKFCFENMNLEPGQYTIALQFVKMAQVIGPAARFLVLTSTKTHKLATIDISETAANLQKIELGDLYVDVTSGAPTKAAVPVHVSVKTKIANWEDVRGKLPKDCYLQVVSLRPDHRLSLTTGDEGRCYYDSIYPRADVLADGSFVFQCPRLRPGKYVIGIQGLILAVFPPPEVRIDSLLRRKRDGKIEAAIIQVPEASTDSPISIDLGETIIYVYES